VILVVMPDDLMPVARAIAPGFTIVGAAQLASRSPDTERVFALGYSEGADRVAAMLLSQPGLFEGAILLRPTQIAVPDPIPDLKDIPVLAVPSRDGSHAVPQLLAKAGAAVDLAVQDADEFLIPQDFALAKRWLAQFA
jgi:phospholipase/carboxylesterase